MVANIAHLYFFATAVAPDVSEYVAPGGQTARTELDWLAGVGAVANIACVVGSALWVGIGLH
jgi:hypothetical protein